MRLLATVAVADARFRFQFGHPRLLPPSSGRDSNDHGRNFRRVMSCAERFKASARTHCCPPFPVTLQFPGQGATRPQSAATLYAPTTYLHTRTTVLHTYGGHKQPRAHT